MSDDNPELLKQFLDEGLSSISDLKDQNDRIRENVTELKVEISSIHEQISNLNRSLEKGQGQLSNKTKKIESEVNDQKNTISEMQRDIVSLQSRNEKVTRLTDEMAELERRIAKTESQQNRWLGALTVIGALIGFFLALLKGSLGI